DLYVTGVQTCALPISERGRMLAEYDAAAWHATDAVQMANPKTAQGQHYIAKKENGKWTVAFGALNAEKSKFLISYEAAQLAQPRSEERRVGKGGRSRG